VLRALTACLAAVLLAAAPAQAGRWLAGDLHVHTTYSHDSWGGPGDDEPTDPTEYYTLGQTVTEDFALALVRGLDFLAISDHNDVRSQHDPGWGFGGVLGIPAYENSLRGHGQMLGATHVYDKGDGGPAAVRAMEDALHADGGLLQANHPTDPVWDYDYADVPVDSVEVWNLPWFYQPPFPASGDHDAALRFGTAILDRGAHVAFTGGSDSHWKSTVAAQGPGQPTTWVYADDRSVAGVLAGIRKGHTAVSWQPPDLGGPRVFLEGRAGHGWSAMQGDTVAPGTPLRVRVRGAPGATLEVRADRGQALATVPVDGPDFTYELTAPSTATYAFAMVYAQDGRDERPAVCAAVPVLELDGQTTYCRNHIGMLGLTSALYFQPAGLPRLP
jgi:hypothetical protein